ncbi:Tetrachloroethene reductive dehalogenase TceA [Dehalobacter sp. UNSWDHB]|jgi:reductive dehalogenase|uniref:reductive dehalogenase n=1 Tax=unclassified Dehalobacter TaxID=2635733 RepID=UPI00028B24C4|nr:MULTISPECIES: reductive dehalogenase [unclassified Dehalobacter]AFV06391.1 putative reductive dehalogenase subunit A [Dehalobacter sp. CF]EQB21091.1 Tetrachloroethene reductive dehalogenase TceA [Dehalobacter sp. UNSWDHB]
MDNEQGKKFQINRRSFLRAGAAATVLGVVGALKAPAKIAKATDGNILYIDPNKVASSSGSNGLQYTPAPKGQWSKLHPVHDLGSAKINYVENNNEWLGTTQIVGKIKNFNEADSGWFLDARGILGDKAQRGFAYLTTRYPLINALNFGSFFVASDDAVYGKPILQKLEIPDPEQMSQHIKDLAYFLRVDDVGIGKMPEYAYYSDHIIDVLGLYSKPVEQCTRPVEKSEYLPYVITFIIDQGMETMLASTGFDSISGSMSYKCYHSNACTSVVLAAYIRNLGYNARACHAMNSYLPFPPALIASGLGELSRTGDSSIHPKWGFRHKASAVLTDLPLAPDKPIDFGLLDFCRVCKKCADNCPAQAISQDADPVEYNGYLRWNSDMRKCAAFRAENEEGNCCGVCMKVCPWNSKEDSWFHQAGTWIGSHGESSAKLLKSIDDMFGYGTEQLLQYKWWLEWPEMNKIPPKLPF